MVVYLLTMRSGSCLYGLFAVYHAIKFLFFCRFLFLSSGELRRVSCCSEIILLPTFRPLLSGAWWEFFNFQVPSPPKNQNMGYGFYQTRCSFFCACRATCGRHPSVTIRLRPSSIHIDKCVPVAIDHQDNGHKIKCFCDATSYLHTPRIFVGVFVCCARVSQSKLVF